MSFTTRHGDLFGNVDAGYIVHGCNAQGVMGSGVAKIIRDKWPLAYDVYRDQKETGYILGEIIPVKVSSDLVIINAITQDRYGTDRVHADYDAIKQALAGCLHLVENSKLSPYPELHMPFIGAGLAGGDQDTILKIIGGTFADAPIEAILWIYP